MVLHVATIFDGADHLLWTDHVVTDASSTDHWHNFAKGGREQLGTDAFWQACGGVHDFHDAVGLAHCVFLNRAKRPLVFEVVELQWHTKLLFFQKGHDLL